MPLLHLLSKPGEGMHGLGGHDLGGREGHTTASMPFQHSTNIVGEDLTLLLFRRAHLRQIFDCSISIRQGDHAQKKRGGDELSERRIALERSPNSSGCFTRLFEIR